MKIATLETMMRGVLHSVVRIPCESVHDWGSSRGHCQRPARLQWKQLTEARRLLDERQHPKVEPKDWWNY